jgi:hypothetical protein
MKYIFIALVLIINSQLLIGQNLDLENIPTKHNIGFAAYSDAGVGISYRYQPKRHGIEITGSPNYIGRENLLLLSIGIKGLYSFYKGEKIELYNYLGTHTAFISGGEYQTRTFLSITGLGAGMNIPILEVLSFNFQIGYGFYHFTDNFERDYFTSISGGIGLYYNF